VLERADQIRKLLGRRRDLEVLRSDRLARAHELEIHTDSPHPAEPDVVGHERDVVFADQILEPEQRIAISDPAEHVDRRAHLARHVDGRSNHLYLEAYLVGVVRVGDVPLAGDVHAALVEPGGEFGRDRDHVGEHPRFDATGDEDLDVFLEVGPQEWLSAEDVHGLELSATVFATEVENPNRLVECH